MPTDDLYFGIATESDLAELVALRNDVAADLTARHGQGHWSGIVTERSQLRDLRGSRLVVVRRRSVGVDAPVTPLARSCSRLVGTLRLATRKPWAIDVRYFTPVPRPLYLHDMAVDPRHQRQGIGRLLVDTARKMALAWPAGALRLDAYDGPAGAGGFYANAGFREVGRAVYRKVPLVYFEWVG